MHLGQYSLTSVERPSCLRSDFVTYDVTLASWFPLWLMQTSLRSSTPICLMIWGAYHLTEKSGWGVESIMVSDLPVYRRNATFVTVWIQKKGEFVSRESGTEKVLRNWLMVSNIPFGSYQPEWKDYLKTYSSIFGWNFRKVTLPFSFHPEFPKFSVKW